MSNFDKLTNWRRRRRRWADRPRVTIPTTTTIVACKIWHELFGWQFVTFDFWSGVNVSHIYMHSNSSTAAIATANSVLFSLHWKRIFSWPARKALYELHAKFSLLFLARHWAAFCPLPLLLSLSLCLPLCLCAKCYSPRRITYTPHIAAISSNLLRRLCGSNKPLNYKTQRPLCTLSCISTWAASFPTLFCWECGSEEHTLRYSVLITFRGAFHYAIPLCIYSLIVALEADIYKTINIMLYYY